MICGEKINLRAVERGDLEQLVRWRNDPEIFRGFFSTFPLSLGAQADWYEDVLRRTDKKLFVIEAKDGQAVGTIGFDHIDWKNQKAEFGNMLVDKGHRGCGYASDATRTALRFGFEQMNLNRIYLEVYAWNQEAVQLYQKSGFEVEGVLRQAYFAEDLEVYAWNQEAVQLYQKSGFEVEGVLRQAYFAEGKFNNTVLMAIVREDWRARGAAGSSGHKGAKV